MASGTAREAAAEDTGPPPRLLRLLRHQDLSIFLPFMLGFSDQQHPPPPSQSDRVVLINPITQGTVVLDHLPPRPSLMDTYHDSHPPASRLSIEGLPRVETITCCTICLEESGEWAREMPCQHRFHGDCIERWLGIHGTCPICRYRMPVEEAAETRKLTGDAHTSDIYNHHRHNINSDTWVSFSFSRRIQSSNDNNSVSSGDDQV